MQINECADVQIDIDTHCICEMYDMQMFKKALSANKRLVIIIESYDPLGSAAL